MVKRYFFPEPVDVDAGRLESDVAGLNAAGVPDQHPDNGAACLSFDVTGWPNGQGAWVIFEKGGYDVDKHHGILETVTPGGGGFECDVYPLHKKGGIRPFHRDGHFLRYSDDGTELLVNESTGFRAFCRYKDQQAAELDAFMESCVENRINRIRVAGCQDTTLYLGDPALRYRIHPHDHPNFFQLVDGFMDYTAGYGVHVSWVLCTQTQTILPNKQDQLNYVGGMFEVLTPRYCCVAKVNEQYVHDNTIEDAVRILPKPPNALFLLSTGSKGAGDESPLEPVVDLIEYHDNDLSEWWRKAHNAWEMANHNNAVGYKSESTRTDKEVASHGHEAALRHYEDDGKTQAAMTAGGIIHTPEGKNADRFDFSLPYIAAHNAGLFHGGVNFRRGRYNRYINPDVLREYSMTTSSEYRWPVRF